MDHGGPGQLVSLRDSLARKAAAAAQGTSLLPSECLCGWEPSPHGLAPLFAEPVMPRGSSFSPATLALLGALLAAGITGVSGWGPYSSHRQLGSEGEIRKIL
jgi:hypothetical protein